MKPSPSDPPEKRTIPISILREMKRMSFSKECRRKIMEDPEQIHSLSRLLFAFQSRFNAAMFSELYCDHLTGTHNRRQLDKIGPNTKASIGFIDINNFKLVNDFFKSHQEWDAILQEVASIIQSSIRKTDQVYRYGWDEFVVLIDTKDPSVLRFIDAEIRSKIRKSELIQNINKQLPKMVCLAIGWSIFHPDHPFEKRMQIADQKMYADKQILECCRKLDCISCTRHNIDLILEAKN